MSIYHFYIYYLLGDYQYWGPNNRNKRPRDVFQPLQIDTWDTHQLRNHNDSNHECYGTLSTKHPSDIRIKVDKQKCNKEIEFCYIKLGYLHSWDKSYIANSECSLYLLNSNNTTITTEKKDVIIKELVYTIDIESDKCPTESVNNAKHIKRHKPSHHSDHQELKHSGPCEHNFNKLPTSHFNNNNNNNMADSKTVEYSLQCTNKQNGLLACITGIQLIVELN